MNLFNRYHMPGPVPGTRDISVEKKKTRFFCHHGTYIPKGEDKKNNNSHVNSKENNGNVCK